MKACGKDVRVKGRVLKIASLDADRYEFINDPEAAIRDLRSSGSRVDIFTFMQGLPPAPPKFSYAAEPDNLAALPVSTYDKWLATQIDAKARNKVRLAEKRGVQVREVPFDDLLVRGISEVYNESPVRQGRAFWHYNKDLDSVRRENQTFLERSTFIAAFLDGRIIGFAKLVEDDDRQQAALMQIVSMISHRDKAPTNALIAQAVRSCADRNIPYLVYANFSYGKKERDSLADFKLANGFLKIDLPRYYVPLTLAGRAALSLGLHHPLKDKVPESVLIRLRKARAAWSARGRVKAEPAATPAAATTVDVRGAHPSE
jgi:hypothetical protein